MANTHPTEIIKDLENKKLKVTRYFDAEPPIVWRAWTESDLLDEWWAPHPWKTETKAMDFREGGAWLYYMVGPDNSRHGCLVGFYKVTPQKSFSITSCFCDENGKKNPDLPAMN